MYYSVNFDEQPRLGINIIVENILNSIYITLILIIILQESKRLPDMVTTSMSGHVVKTAEFSLATMCDVPFKTRCFL